MNSEIKKKKIVLAVLDKTDTLVRSVVMMPLGEIYSKINKYARRLYNISMSNPTSKIELLCMFRENRVGLRMSDTYPYRNIQIAELQWFFNPIIKNL